MFICNDSPTHSMMMGLALLHGHCQNWKHLWLESCPHQPSLRHTHFLQWDLPLTWQLILDINSSDQHKIFTTLLYHEANSISLEIFKDRSCVFFPFLHEVFDFSRLNILHSSSGMFFPPWFLPLLWLCFTVFMSSL